MKKTLSLLSALLVVGSLSGVAHAREATSTVAPSTGCGAGHDQNVRTLRVVTWTRASRYTVGTTARVHVEVTRQAADQSGSEPADGVKVTVALTPKRGGYAGGAALTDDEGNAVIKIKLPKDMARGYVDAYAEATNQLASAPCVHPQEAGDDTKVRFFRVVRSL
jgi:hypothetical protein